MKSLKKYAVLGNPIAHSLSPQIHQAFAEQFNLKISYERILIAPTELAHTLEQFELSGGSGVNITAPFKVEAAQLTKDNSVRAYAAGAVNTITFMGNGWQGDNTDGVGLVRDLVQNHHLELKDKTILIIGAGGAARGILPALIALKPQSLLIANRTRSAAVELAALYADICQATDLKNIPPIPFDIIINATSAGNAGESLQFASALSAATFCYDLGYGQAAQPFLKWAHAQGAKKYSDGLGMLVEQAAEAFYSWHQLMPKTQTLIHSLKTS